MLFFPNMAYYRRFYNRRYRRYNYPRKWNRKTNTFTSVKGTGSHLPYVKKKMNWRTWQRALWNHTNILSHYRSTKERYIGVTGYDSIGKMFIGAAFPLSDQYPFWVPSGGSLKRDVSETNDTLENRDIVIRGGIVGIHIAFRNNDTKDCLVKVWIMKTKNRPDASKIVTPMPIGWDPSLSPDVTTEFGKVIGYREATLSGHNSSLTVEHKLKIQKLDKQDFMVNHGNQIMFVYGLAQLSGSTGIENTQIDGSSIVNPVAVEYDIMVYHNISYCWL